MAEIAGERADSVYAGWHAPLLLGADTIEGPVEKAIVIEADAPAEASLRREAFAGKSWIILGLLLLVAGICLRVRDNSKYLTALLRDLWDVRERHNAFDDTVRETSILVLLNILWSVSWGVILYYLLLESAGSAGWNSLGTGSLTSNPIGCCGICICCALGYTGLMTAAYATVGNVFSDRVHASMWVKGFLAAQGLGSVAAFPTALLLLSYPGIDRALLWVASGGFAITKIIFLIKGFRIFFTQSSSWVLFLYYLCSLEIVPLILTYFASLTLCALI